MRKFLHARRFYPAVFCVFWCIAFLLYLPAAKAGLVADFPGWVKWLRTLSLPDFLNRKWSYIPGMYQGTGLVTWLLFQLCGTHAWPWHLVCITFHTLNATLLCAFVSRLLRDADVALHRQAGIISAALFLITPYATEAVVWEPAFHYLQALALMLGVLLLTLRFQEAPQLRTALGAGLLFAFIIFTLELFYITPLLTLLIALYYRAALCRSRLILRRTLLAIMLPQVLLLGVHQYLLHRMYGVAIARGDARYMLHPLSLLAKPAKSVFHLLLSGSLFPDNLRQAVYHFLSSHPGYEIVWGVLLLSIGMAMWRFGSMSRLGRANFMLLIIACTGLLLTIPLEFEEHERISCTRYLYVPAGLFFPFVGVSLFRIRVAWAKTLAIAALAIPACIFCFLLSIKWAQSARVLSGFIDHHPPLSGKVVLLLNNPRSLDGAPMVAAEDPSLMKALSAIYTRPIADSLYDVAAYNMIGPADGAHVRVRNDSMIEVSLNQEGSWWTYDGRGAENYENAAYRFHILDVCHTYELTLRQPAANYLLIYQSGERWKVVDMARRGVEQY